MSNNVLKSVPLPEVPEHTDDLVFENLDLPVGFDEERLLVNLSAINRVRRIAGLGRVSIVGTDGKAEKEDFQITGISSSGAATASASKRDKSPLSQSSVRFPNGATFFNSADTTITINNTEVEAQIHEGSSEGNRLFDPNARAKLLDRGITRGLVRASLDANFDTEKFRISGRYYGLFGGLGLITGADMLKLMPTITVLGPLMFNAAQANNAITDSITKNVQKGDVKKHILEFLKSSRQSVFVGVAPDRFIAAAGLAKASRLIKARK